MKRYLFNNFSFFIIILYFSLLVGFYLNENSTGGAIKDYFNQKVISINFSNEFLNTLLNYDKTSTRHSPVLIILFSAFEKYGVNDFIIRLINLHVCLFLPLIFFKCLKIKFRNIDEKYLILFSGLIFLSPTFRSLAIWPDSRIWGLLFFCFSIYFFLIYEKNKNSNYCFLVIIFYSIASYLSPNFSVFSIFFMVIFFKDLKFQKLLQLVLLNLILSFPAFYYVFILDVNFMFSASAVPGGIENSAGLNIFNKIALISSIFIFYLIPFLISKSIQIPFKNINLKNLIFVLILSLVSIFFFTYKYEYSGGGIFFKISYLIFNNNFLFFLVFAVSLIINFLIFSFSKYNFLIIVLIILSNPQMTIYHKYYDPFLLILFLTLFDLNLIKAKLFSKKSIVFFYLFSLFFLVLSISKAYIN